MTSTSEVAALLRERILSGEISSGARLQQVPLSESLGVSRTPLREALAQLANQGLLVYEPNRGYAVRAFSVAEIGAAFEVRARLEALACSLCAQRGLPGGVLDQLRACIEEGDRILAKGVLDPADLSPYRRMNVDFHESIIRSSGNPFVGDFIRQCHNVPLASDRVFVWEDYGVIVRSHDDHRRILGALEMRDAERADYLMREHVRFAGFILLRKLERSQAFEPRLRGSSVERNGLGTG
ncbi:GntR family transcriptional regulator, vanillate catabolism transcriptional regulator [Rhizobiales bacterium GAS191]|nr:GntR family transcriptional regulator, vanillate catabolism transcriptional regulator [Rhizobiales bacterium GAS191]